MLDFKEWLVATIKNDSTITGFIGNNVFPMDIDVQPENFPCITYSEVGVAILSRPQGMHVGTFQLDIWSTNNAYEVEQIYEEVAKILNFKDSTTQSITGTLWWIREDGVRDLHTPSRRVWRKVIDLKIWYSKTNFT